MVSGTVKERNFFHWSSWREPPASATLDTRKAWTLSHYWSAKIQQHPIVPEEPFTAGNLHFGSEHPISKFINKMTSMGKAHSELLKEYVFDDVRVAEFPDLPSRRRCSFLLDAQHDPYIFAKQLGWTTPTALYEVTVIEGSLHRAKLSLLNCNTKSPHELRAQARLYWSPTEPDLDAEVLFEGVMRLRLVTSSPTVVDANSSNPSAG